MNTPIQEGLHGLGLADLVGLLRPRLLKAHEAHGDLELGDQLVRRERVVWGARSVSVEGKREIE